MEIGFHQLKLAHSSVQKTSLFQTKKGTLARDRRVAEGSSHPISGSLQGLRSQPFRDHPDSLESQAHQDLLEKVYSLSSSPSLTKPHLTGSGSDGARERAVSPSLSLGWAQELEAGHPNDKGEAQGQGWGTDNVLWGVTSGGQARPGHGSWLTFTN